MQFVHGTKPTPPPQGEPQASGERVLPPPGWHVCMIVRVNESFVTSGGKSCARLELECQFGAFRTFPVLIPLGPDGNPKPGGYGRDRIEAIADAIGIHDGEAYTLEALVAAPFRVLVELNGKYRNATKFATCSLEERKALSEFRARLGHIEEGGM